MNGRYLEQQMIGVTNPADLAESNIIDYARLWSNCCTAVKDNATADISRLLSQCAARMRARSFAQVKDSAMAGSAEDSLEAGLRMYAGCTVRQDQDGAMWYWLRLVDRQVYGYIPNVSRSLRARAYSCLAGVHDERRIVDDGTTWNIDSLYRAGKCADDCAALGLATPMVLSIGATIERAGFRRKEDLKFPGWDTKRFEVLVSLWEVVDKRSAEFGQKMKKIEEKIEQNPNAYRCAASGCGVEATKKSGLMRCSGPCGLEAKPSYCSKECQRRDWRRHKAVCKPHAKERATQSTAEEPSAEASSSIPEVADEDRINRDGKERAVYMPDPNRPGETIRVASKTMSAAFMREIRETTYQILEERNSSSGRSSH